MAKVRLTQIGLALLFVVTILLAHVAVRYRAAGMGYRSEAEIDAAFAQRFGGGR